MKWAKIGPAPRCAAALEAVPVEPQWRGRGRPADSLRTPCGLSAHAIRADSIGPGFGEEQGGAGGAHPGSAPHPPAPPQCSCYPLLLEKAEAEALSGAVDPKTRRRRRPHLIDSVILIWCAIRGPRPAPPRPPGRRLQTVHSPLRNVKCYKHSEGFPSQTARRAVTLFIIRPTLPRQRRVSQVDLPARLARPHAVQRCAAHRPVFACESGCRRPDQGVASPSRLVCGVPAGWGPRQVPARPRQVPDAT